MTEPKQPIVVAPEDWNDLMTIHMALRADSSAMGINCYGLLRDVYKCLNVELPERSESSITPEIIESEGLDWTEIEQPAPYCIVLMRGHQGGFHVGIITPELKILHSTTKKGVMCSRLDKYDSLIIGFYIYTPGAGNLRLPECAGPIGKIIAGVVLIAVGFVASLTGIGNFASPFLYKVGIGLIVSGVVEGVITLMTDKPKLSGYDGDLSDSRTYSWDGIINDFRQGLPKAMVFGVCKVGGQIISEKTWFDGENQEYLDILICPAGSRITRFSGLQINDTDLNYYADAAAVFRPGDDEQTPIDMFDKIYTQFGSQAKLSLEPVVFSTKSPLTGIRITLIAPSGLYNISGSSAVAASVVTNIEYKPQASSTWAAVPAGDPVYADALAFLDAAGGTFSGAANPFTLTDAGAGFTTALEAGQQFRLEVAGVTYHCTQIASLTADAVQFNAFTDSGRTTAKTGAFSNGAYRLFHNTDLRPDISGTWRVASGFTTEVECSAIKFKLVAKSELYTWMRLAVWYRPEGGTWKKHDLYEPGLSFRSYIIPVTAVIGTMHRSFEIKGLAPGKYQVVVNIENNGTDMTLPTLDNITLADIQLDTEYNPGVFTITGYTAAPLRLAQKEVELLNLPEGEYDFRVWRTTEDSTGLTSQNGVFLRGYAEVIERTLAYPGHALTGIRAMATDRLYGGRPKVTSIATGPPLSVPSGAISTTVYDDEGLVSGTGNIFNGVVVDGMRKIVVFADVGTGDGAYYWLVRMDSPGLAQSNRLLTKWYCRAHTWETTGGKTRFFIENSEGIPDGTALLIFHETLAEVSNPAWGVAKVLIDGSHGRITENHIDWTSFAEWAAWCRTNDYRFAGVIDFSADLWGTAFRMAATARGNLIASGGKYKVIIDQAWTGLPAQVFTEGNTRNVSVDFIPKKDRANILVASFLDAEQDYVQRDISIEDVREGEFPIVATLPVMVGVTRESQVEAIMRHTLRQNRLIEKTIVFDAGIDSIEVELGDVFAFASQAHDFAISGRLRNVVNGNVTLDQTYTPEDGETYKLTIWGETVITWTGVLTGATTVIPGAMPGVTADEYYRWPYMLAKVSDDISLYRCSNLKRIPETMFATISGIEYRPEIYAED